MNSIKIKDYGFNEFFERQINEVYKEENGLVPARVIEVHKDQYKIITEFGESNAKLKGSIFYNGHPYVIYPAVGDFALVKHNPIGEDIIYKIFDRISKFSRMDSYNKIEQLVATNFNYVFIMTSLNYDFNIKRLERYLATAWQSGAQPVIILTKADLCEDYEEKRVAVMDIAIGVPVIAVSSVTGEGLDDIKEYIRPCKTVVFLGSSGVGKSSLVNAIAGDEVMKVNSIREDDSKGRHTTTHRQLIMLDNRTMIIDTPGMRELEMWNVSDGLESTFSEIEDLAANCKFRDCNHGSEPGCAVRKALETGELSEDRWNNYLKLKKEARFAKRKEESLMRAKDKAGKKRR